MPAAVCPTIDFGPLRIAYDDRVLHPRAWTLLQSHWATELCSTVPDGPVLELCSGAGHIGLAAIAPTDRRLVQVDRNPAACDFADRNARTAGLEERVEVRCGDLTGTVGLGEVYPLVLADPPYLPTADLDRHPEDPPTAIDGGADGLTLLRACVEVIDRVLPARGAALVQVLGASQAEELAAVLPPDLAMQEVRSHDEQRAVALLRRTGATPEDATPRSAHPQER